MVDMFDTLGTLYGACARGGMLDKDGNVPNFEKAMLSDAIATCAGAVCGTSTVTTFCGVFIRRCRRRKNRISFFYNRNIVFIAMFLSPVAALIPGSATAAALIYVGVLMMGCVTDIDWKDISIAVPAFFNNSIYVFYV